MINVDSLKEVECLIYYDGPLLSHVIDKDGNNYLQSWVNIKRGNNIWILSRLDKKIIDKISTGKLPITEMFNRTLELYELSIDNNIQIKNCKRIKLKDVPNEYKQCDDYYIDG